MSDVIPRAIAEPQWAAFVAIDWGEQRHYWALQAAGSAESEWEKGELEHTPEAVEEWAVQLCRRFGGQPIAVCLEQSRGALVYQLSKYAHLVLYPIHPNAAAEFRKALHPSGAKSDGADAADLLEYLIHHRNHLRRLDPDTPETRKLKMLVEQRRHLVDEKTRLSNRITGWLKIYFPQVLSWIDDIDSPLGLDLLERWPTLDVIKRVKPNVLARFFRQHNCRSEQRIQERIDAIYAAQPAITDTAMLEAGPAIVSSWVRAAKAYAQGIAEFDQQIEQALAVHPETALFRSFPGLGPALLPRVVAAFGTNRERFTTAADLQRYSGVAPVTEQSGKTKIVHMRWACPRFLRQSFLEWAARSTEKSRWARAFYDLKRSEKMKHNAIIRALAYKWQRIAFICWKRNTPYNEQLYLDALNRTRFAHRHQAPVENRRRLFQAEPR